jgi:hypothetical protein
MEHTGRCDSLSDYVIDHNVWGDFTLRSGMYTNVAVGSWNVTCFLFSNPSPGTDTEEQFTYELARRDDTYANIFTIDIDNDGDKDALIGDSGAGNSLLVINGGDSSDALMVPPQDTMFPSYDVPVHVHSFAAHSYLDADNDGIKDLLVSQSEWENKKGVLFYKNTGTTQLPHFSFSINDFLQEQMIDVGESATPVFIDVDADGLMDLVIGNRYCTTSDTTTSTGLSLYKNIGSATVPAFEFVTEDYAGLVGLNLTGQIAAAFGDVDHDGDTDMILGMDDGSITYFSNTAGPGQALAFGAPVFNFLSIDVGQACTPQLVDLNRDGFAYLIAGQKNGLVKYFQNTMIAGTPFNTTATNDSLGGINLRTPQTTDGFTSAYAFEQSGDYRMAVSNMQGFVFLYGGIDGNLGGAFTILDTIISQTEGSRYGYNIFVSGGEINGDTLTDLVFGLYGGGVQVYYQENITNDITSIDSQDLFQVLPNPVHDKLIIKSSLMNGSIDLFDLTGKRLLSKKMKAGYVIVDVASLPEGAYFVRLSSEGRIASGKIIISR